MRRRRRSGRKGRERPGARNQAVSPSSGFQGEFSAAPAAAAFCSASMARAIRASLRESLNFNFPRGDRRRKNCYQTEPLPEEIPSLNYTLFKGKIAFRAEPNPPPEISQNGGTSKIHATVILNDEKEIHLIKQNDQANF